MNRRQFLQTAPIAAAFTYATYRLPDFRPWFVVATPNETQIPMAVPTAVGPGDLVPIPTNTPTATSTLAPTATATLAPTATPTATATLTPSPTATPRPVWKLFLPFVKGDDL